MPGATARENGKKSRGRPPGAENVSTTRKRAIRQFFLKEFEKDAKEFYQAMKAQALGTKYLVTRDIKTGKFINLDAKQVELMLQCGQAERIEVWDHLPSVQAFTAIADRAIDKPTEHHEVAGEGGGPIEFIATLTSARKRATQSR